MCYSNNSMVKRGLSFLSESILKRDRTFVPRGSRGYEDSRAKHAISRVAMGEILRIRAGYGIFLIILGAPFLWGGNELLPESCFIVSILLVTLVWVASLTFESRLPRVPPLILGCAMLVLTQGWIMTWNARSVLDREFLTFLPLENSLSFLPASVDSASSARAMIRISGLLMMMLVVTDLAKSTRWLRLMMHALASSGLCFALLGIWQKTAREPLELWAEGTPETAFSTLGYHGSAAALLNIAWPALLALTIWAFRARGGDYYKALCLAGLGAIAAGLAMNPSKAGHLIAGGLVCLVALVFLLRIRSVIVKHGWRQIIAFSGLSVAGLAILITYVDTTVSARRWEEWYGRNNWDSRLDVADICLETMPKWNLFGSGPGTFEGVFYNRAAEIGRKPGAIWKHAHNDIIQYFVEWGWIGGATWLTLWAVCFYRGVCVFWALVRPGFGFEIRRPRRSRDRWNNSFDAMRLYLLFGVSLSFIGVLTHAVMDYPLQIRVVQIFTFAVAGALAAIPNAKIGDVAFVKHSNSTKHPEKIDIRMLAKNKSL